MLVVVGALLALSAGRQAADLFVADQGWIPASATVLRTRVAAVNSSAGRSASGLLNASATSHRVYHELVYFVKGNRYSASVESGTFATRADALASLARSTPGGSAMHIWVNAKDFSQALTEAPQREAGAGAITVFALLGLFALQLGATLIRSGLRGENSARESASSPIHSQPVASH
ncbi:MAG: hypothetical protein U5J83_13665 [Bryobacterales bacterium]|nr:hypothetical protein [Bryobacterales bacterium]